MTKDIKSGLRPLTEAEIDAVAGARCEKELCCKPPPKVVICAPPPPPPCCHPCCAVESGSPA